MGPFRRESHFVALFSSLRPALFSLRTTFRRPVRAWSSAFLLFRHEQKRYAVAETRRMKQKNRYVANHLYGPVSSRITFRHPVFVFVSGCFLRDPHFVALCVPGCLLFCCFATNKKGMLLFCHERKRYAVAETRRMKQKNKHVVNHMYGPERVVPLRTKKV